MGGGRRDNSITTEGGLKWKMENVREKITEMSQKCHRNDGQDLINSHVSMIQIDSCHNNGKLYLGSLGSSKLIFIIESPHKDMSLDVLGAGDLDFLGGGLRHGPLPLLLFIVRGQEGEAGGSVVIISSWSSYDGETVNFTVYTATLTLLDGHLHVPVKLKGEILMSTWG